MKLIATLTVDGLHEYLTKLAAMPAYKTPKNLVIEMDGNKFHVYSK